MGTVYDEIEEDGVGTEFDNQTERRGPKSEVRSLRNYKEKHGGEEEDDRVTRVNTDEEGEVWISMIISDDPRLAVRHIPKIIIIDIYAPIHEAVFRATNELGIPFSDY